MNCPLSHAHGWSDTQVAGLLGIHFSNVSRRRVNGFSVEQVEAMCQAIITDRGR